MYKIELKRIEILIRKRHKNITVGYIKEYMTKLKHNGVFKNKDGILRFEECETEWENVKIFTEYIYVFVYKKTNLQEVKNINCANRDVSI